HSWPGNVRELEQVIVAAASMCHANQIRVADLPLPQREPKTSESPFEHLRGLPLTEAKTLLVEQFERAAVQAALTDNNGNVSAAARQLGLHRQSLQQKMTQLGIER
ncbi:MAG: sigma-54-dependent Fis family transcriptional regulator, partial [Planctomycetia bacterium]|nr:sigma-54-dependent Fis family transcriptional regulator [Planctomycetia bacterium]